MIYEWWIFHHLCHEVLERRWVERWSQLQVHPSEPLRALRRSKPRGSARRVLTKTSKISTDAQYMSLKIVCFRWFQKFSINAFLKNIKIHLIISSCPFFKAILGQYISGSAQTFPLLRCSQPPRRSSRVSTRFSNRQFIRCQSVVVDVIICHMSDNGYKWILMDISFIYDG